MMQAQQEQQQMMQLQIDALQNMLGRIATCDTGETWRDRVGDIAEHVHLAQMTEADDMEAYLTTFERVIQLG